MARRGPKPRSPTAADRTKVRELLAEKAPISDVAKMMGMSQPTFRKHFRAEIDVAKSSGPVRPARKITQSMRDKVQRYIACKMTVQQVAYVMGYVEPDELALFKADFQSDIEVGAALYRAKVIDRLDAQMEGGVTGATNRLEGMTQLAPPEGKFKARDEGVAYRGKKQAAIEDARDAVKGDSKFAPRARLRVATSDGKAVK